MKVLEEANPIQSSFAGRKMMSRIANNSIMMETLRNKIYEFPRASICREVADNARDAHRVVGTPQRKVQIWMPGDYLVIKDFGPGMTPETIEDVYLVFGESTKRNDNLQGGGFGLGAKTPWAYTDSFIVVTIVDGTEWTYSFFIDEERKGCCQLISENDTNEENGTTVKIPIRPENRQEFRNHIAWYTKYWDFAGDAIPEYLGDWKPERPKIICRDTDWVYWEGKGEIPKYIINGIPYERNDGYSYYGDIKNVSYIFNTGDLELVSNREKVQNTTKNTAKIEAVKKDIGSKIVTKLMGDLDKIDDPLEVLNKIIPLHNQFAHAGWNNKWKWKGVDFQYPMEDKSVMHFYQRQTRKSKQYRYGFDNKLPGSHNADNLLLSDKPLEDSNGFKREWIKYIKAQLPSYDGTSSLYLVNLNNCPILKNSDLEIFTPVIKQGKSYVRKTVRITVDNIFSGRETLATTGLKNTRYYLSRTEYNDMTNSLYGLSNNIKEYTIIVEDDDIQHVEDAPKFKKFTEWLQEEITNIPQKDIDLYFSYKNNTSKEYDIYKWGRFATIDDDAKMIQSSYEAYTQYQEKDFILSLAQELKLITPKVSVLKSLSKKYPLLSYLSVYELDDGKKDVNEYILLKQGKLP